MLTQAQVTPPRAPEHQHSDQKKLTGGEGSVQLRLSLGMQLTRPNRL